MNSNQEEFNKEKNKFAKNITTKYAIADEIAKQEKITLTEKEYKDYLDINKVEKVEQKVYEENIKDELLYQKVLDFVLEKSLIIED